MWFELSKCGCAVRQQAPIIVYSSIRLFVLLSSHSFIWSNCVHLRMPFNFSAAPSSRIVKKRQSKTPLLKLSSSSLTNGPSKSAHEVDDDEDDIFLDRLDEIALVHSLRTDLSLRDVPQTMQHIRVHMFDPVPESGGMNSTRIAEVLNFRKSLPPMVTLAHIHALVGSPTAVEREIAELTIAGLIRKTVVPGRGKGASSISEGIILSKDLKILVKEIDGLDNKIKGKGILHLVVP